MENSYLERLKKRASDAGSILCMGIDPLLEDIPIKGDTEHVITQFYFDILNGMEDSGSKIPSVKPNTAFFEQYGFEGLRALKKIIEHAKSMEIDVILDAKRGDIGKTAKAYAKSAFEFWRADAITIHPYLGEESIAPFLENGHGVYVQVRNSNKSAVDMQDMNVGRKKLYEKVGELVSGKWYRPGIGAVVGATYTKELDSLAALFSASKKEIPMLIPGVGAQGGDAEETIGILRRHGDISIHRVNSSSGISYAYKKDMESDYVGAAVREIKRLNKALKV